LHTLLLVEVSATLRHLLRRSLAARADLQLVEATTFEAGLAQVRRATPCDFSAVIFGSPPDEYPAAQAMLRELRQGGARETAMLILAHAADAASFDWVARRPRTALLLWSDYTQCPVCLDRLLTVAPAAPANTAHAGRGDIRVLLVDDSKTVRESYRKLLAGHGYAVEVAANVTEGQALARLGDFDIAIVDYFMPGGNGDELCRRLRDDSATAHITASILTGAYQEDIIQECLAAGAVECMFKNEAKELFLARLAAMSRAVRNRKSIEAERARLAGILGSVGDGVYGVDRAGRITFINPAACQILGYDGLAPVAGRAAHGLIHYAAEDGRPTSAADCPLARAYTGAGPLIGHETVFWHRGGRPIPVECTVYPLRVAGEAEGSVVAFRDISERRLLERELLWQATHDPLTKLHNRNHFERHLENEVQRLKRSTEVSALLYIDLDRFKYINDVAGHAAGDQLLIEIGQQLQSRLRDADLLARLGGDEFAVILCNVGPANVQAVAESFRQLLDEHSFVHAGRRYKVNGSIGVALIDGDTQSPGEVLANADIACHLAKRQGRNQVHVYRPESDAKMAMNLELGWSGRLQEALKGDGFALYFQPIVSVEGWSPQDAGATRRAPSARLAPHYEVLVRLKGDPGEVIAPGVFLPTAERFGLMTQIDIWVLTHALAKLAALQASGRRPMFTINISGQTLESDSFVALLERLLKQHRLDPHALIFEITETSAIENIEAAKRLIGNLRALGCRFALDDFGSGFSSFHHLKHLPVDYIKIDGQFVRGMASDPTDRAIVTSINDIAHSFGKRTVAEFVEEEQTLALLREFGVDYAQGFFISEPQAEPPPVVATLRPVGQAARRPG
jgi:diguanylate cyclase (GGDEF)-like protein/PAS domain S-box-containing protein